MDNVNNNKLIDFISDRENLDKFKIEKTFFIASLPVVGYLIAFFYNWGFLDFFNVPLYLMNIGIENIIISTTIVLVVTMLVFVFIFLLYILSSKLPNKQKIIQPPKKTSVKEQVAIGVVALLIFSLFVIFGIHIGLIFKLLIIFSAFILLTFILFGLPYYYFPHEDFFVDTLNKYYERDYQIKLKQSETPNKIPFFSYLYNSPLRGYTIYFILIMSWALIAAMSGSFIASRTKEFNTFSEDGTDYIIISVYNDKFVSISVDKNHNITTDYLKISSLDSLKNVQKENIGFINQYKREQNQGLSK